MPSTLPITRHPPVSRPARWAGLLVATATVWVASGAYALGLTLSSPREEGGRLYANLVVSDLFEPRVRESLGRGMPATLQVRAELWRRRNGWFDRHETSSEVQVRIRYEAWNDVFRIERIGHDVIRVASLDSVASLLSRAWAVPVARIGRLRSGPRYYLVVSAVLRPLSVEDVREVEGWLSGEVKNQGEAGFGVVTELPRALFDAVRNFAGFGDTSTRAVSEEFEMEDLVPGHTLPDEP